MKIILYLTLTFLLLFSNSIKAKTQGHYLGPSINYISANFINASYINDDPGIDYKHNKISKRRNGKNLGINYGYAFNYNKFFITPRLFYDKININNKMKKVDITIENVLTITDDYSLNNSLESSYGFAIDLGYDLNDIFSIYSIIGNKNYNILSHYQHYTHTSVSGVPFGNSMNLLSIKNNIRSLFYGIGAKYQKNNIAISFNLEISEINNNKRKILSYQSDADPIVDYLHIKDNNNIENITLFKILFQQNF
jgi:opacity protein-like surface antigen